MPTDRVDRRTFLAGAAAGAAALTLPLPRAAAAAPGTIALPSGAQVREDFQRMVDFGPRYTGTAGHDGFIDWLEEELIAAGCVMLPRDHFELTIWEARRWGLELLDADGKGPVDVSAYFPRSRETPESGVTGPLVYAGAAPLPALDASLDGILAGLGKYPEQLTSWVQALAGTPHVAPGAILLVDLPMPLALTTGAFVPLMTHMQWSGHDLSDWLTGDFKRTALAPGITGVPLAPFRALGAAGVVFILDASAEALRGGYMPFENAFEEVPALFVDRDTGTRLRALAGQAPQARLTLTADRREGTSPAILGYLPAESDESIVLTSHTDGEGFVEENGGVAMVQLARHFGSLPSSQRLKRTLVFSLWPGHMASGMPQLSGVLEKHPDIVRGAAAAITIEHLGCSEWIDTADKGYHPTGEAEFLPVWTTQGRLFELTRDATVAADLPHTALMRPPAQFGVGGAWQTAGVPQIGYLTGPCYLLNDAPGSDMDKLDEALAARQIAWTADLIRRIDATPADALLGGDPTLGARSAGPRATFPALPAVELGVTLNTPAWTRLRRGGALHGRVMLNRVGLVRLHAAVEHTRKGRRVRTPLADALVHVPGPGAHAYDLALTSRGRAALKRIERGRVVVTARFRERGTATVRSARRTPR